MLRCSWKNHALRGGNREAKVPDGRSLQDCNGTVGPAWLKMRAASATCIFKVLQRAGVKHKKNCVRHACCGCEAGDAHVCSAVTWLRCVVCGADSRVGSLYLNTSCTTEFPGCCNSTVGKLRALGSHKVCTAAMRLSMLSAPLLPTTGSFVCLRIGAMALLFNHQSRKRHPSIYSVAAHRQLVCGAVAAP